MRPTLSRCSILACAVACCSCTIVDIQGGGEDGGARSRGLIEGYATAGWAHDPPVLKLELLGGHSRGSFLRLDVWHLTRLELGVAGASAGIGPLDAGAGVLWYEPRPLPRQPREKKKG